MNSPQASTSDIHPQLQQVAVTGGRGMLGTDVIRSLSAHGWGAQALDLPEFDLRDAAAMSAALAEADAVVNCAAYTNVDQAEREPELAAAVNADAVGRLGAWAARHRKYVLHISTDFVFDGQGDHPYSEDDPPCPLSVYGRTKLAGEQALADSGCRHAIVRIQWTYGAAGNHFIRKLLERARQTPDVKMVDDQVGSPTWTAEVAEALCFLLAHRVEGLYHFAAAGYASRFEVAEFAVRELGLSCRLARCRTADFPAPARRPLNSRFDCRRIDAILPKPRRAWEDALREFLATMRETGHA